MLFFFQTLITNITNKRKLLTLAFLLAGCISAQTQSTLYFEIRDVKTNTPLSGVTVSLVQGSKLLSVGKTDEAGKFNAKTRATGKLTVNCTAPNYETFERELEIELDSLFFLLSLRPVKIQEIKEVVVKAPGAVDTVFGSDRLSVEDFEVLSNGNLLLLTYSKRLTKGSELILFDGQQYLNSFPIPGRADHLEKDYRGNVHVICTDRVFTILSEKNNLQIAQLDKDYFYRYIAPILDTNGHDLYFSDFDKNYPEFSVWKFDQVDSAYLKFRTVRDDLMMELYRAEYKWVDVRTKLWAKNLEYQTGIDAEIWVGANYFTRSVYYKELYAPFFKVNSSLLVFDYYREQMYTHQLDGTIKDSAELTHHLYKKETGWKSELIQDKVTGNIFAWFEKAGTSYLGKIDLLSGEIQEKYQLNFKYLNKIEIHNNFVYYIYRPFESPQKKFLYKEKLPLSLTVEN